MKPSKSSTNAERALGMSILLSGRDMVINIIHKKRSMRYVIQRSCSMTISTRLRSALTAPAVAPGSRDGSTI